MSDVLHTHHPPPSWHYVCLVALFLITLCVAAVAATSYLLPLHTFVPPPTPVTGRASCPPGMVYGASGCAICAQDQDCPHSETCVGGECLRTCDHDAACPAGVCVHGVCRECVEDSDCTGRCAGGKCVECVGHGDCPEGQNCTLGACRSMCWAARGGTAPSEEEEWVSPCGEHHVCDPSTHGCVQCNTWVNNCPADRPFCENKTCVACTQDAQCEGVARCIHNVCKEITCADPGVSAHPMLLQRSDGQCMQSTQGRLTFGPCGTDDRRQWWVFDTFSNGPALRHANGLDGDKPVLALSLDASDDGSAVLDTNDARVHLAPLGAGFTVQLDRTGKYLQASGVYGDSSTSTWRAIYVRGSGCHV